MAQYRDYDADPPRRSYADEEYYHPRPRASSANAILWLFVGFIALAVMFGIGVLILPDLQARYASAPVVIATQPPAQPVRHPVQPAPVRPQAAPVVIRTQGDAPPPVIQPPAVQPVADPGAVQVAPAVAPAAAPIVIVQHENSGGSVTITGSGACAVHAGVARRCGDK